MIVSVMQFPLLFVPCNENGHFHLLLLLASADAVSRVTALVLLLLVEFSAEVFFVWRIIHNHDRDVSPM
jgi:hypothetical protein